MFASRTFRLASLFACVLMAFSMVSVGQAEARRGGSFGSRGTRTFQSAPATNTAPNVGAPLQRSMTPNTQANAARPNAAAAQQRGGFMGGFGGSMLRGLMFGGLLGLLFGGGIGGMAGLFGLLVQGLLIAGAVFLLMRFLRSRSGQPSLAGNAPRNSMNNTPYEAPRSTGGSGGTGNLGSKLGAGLSGLGVGSRAPNTAPRKGNPDELGIGAVDLDIFETMLTKVQSAFGREDYTALRQLTTPEMMSYLSEELGENASNGVKNEVSEVKLLQGDVSESWREGDTEYATTAMRYSSIDVTRDRASGKVTEGNAQEATEATELWTFVRPRGGEWKLSAIQDA